MSKLFNIATEVGLKRLLSELEKALIKKALNKTGNYSEAAKLLKIKRTTLVEKRRTYKLSMGVRVDEKPFKSKAVGNE